jgi:methionyl-tRNA formyltransferase
MLAKEEGRLDFSQPAEALERRIRAFQPWPGAVMDWQGQPLKIGRAHVVPGSALPGRRSIVDSLPAVGCASGLLVLDEVQPAGKRMMPANEFLRGTRNWAES